MRWDTRLGVTVPLPPSIRVHMGPRLGMPATCSSARTATGSGTIRSLPPLPTTRRNGVSKSMTSSLVIPAISMHRRPQNAASAIQARISGSAPAIARAMSVSLSGLGSRTGSRGRIRNTEGSSGLWP